MDHESQMRTLKLMGEEVLPAMREIAKELGLPGPYDVDPATDKNLKELLLAPEARTETLTPPRFG